MKLLRATLLIALLCIIVEYPSSLSASSNDDDQLEEGNRLTGPKSNRLKDWYRRRLNHWLRKKVPKFITPSPVIEEQDPQIDIQAITRRRENTSSTENIDLTSGNIINRISNGISAFIESSMVDLHEEWVLKNQFFHENSISHGFWRQDAAECPCPSSSFDCPTRTLLNATTDSDGMVFSYFTCSTSSECTNICSATLTCNPKCTIYTQTEVTYFTSYAYFTVVDITSITTGEGKNSSTFITSGGLPTCGSITTCTTTSSGGGGGGGGTNIYYATTNIYNAGPPPSHGGGGGGALLGKKIPGPIAAAAAGVAIGYGAAKHAPGLLKKAYDANASLRDRPNPAVQMQQQLSHYFRGYHHQGLRGGVPSIEPYILPAPEVPINDMPIPVRADPRYNGILMDDGCGDASVRFADGQCYPLLSQGPCYDDRHWLIIDPISFTPRCSLRLCGQGRVFVGRDGLCHEIEDAPDECPGGRRLYYTAFGDPVCDCPLGQYPFPGPRDECVPLFIQGPCLPGLILTFSRPDGVLGCFPTECSLVPSLDDERDLQRLLPSADGYCYEFGSRGPCNQGFTFTFDLFKLKTLCIGERNGWLFLSDLESNYVYFVKDQDDNELVHAAAVNHHHQMEEEENEGVYRVTMVLKNKKQSASIISSDAVTQLQPSVLYGRDNSDEEHPEVLLYADQTATQLPGVHQQRRQIPPDPLLNPCRPGARIGYNYKCANPILSTELGVRRSSNGGGNEMAVRPDYTCPDNDEILLASGRCGDRKHGVSCGPSFDYDEENNQCRSMLLRHRRDSSTHSKRIKKSKNIKQSG